MNEFGLVAVDDAGTVYGLDDDDGQVRWEHRLGGVPTADPVMVGGVAVLATHDGLVGAAADTGDVRFRTPIAGPSGFVALSDNRVLVSQADGRVTAVDVKNGGTVLWRTRVGTSAPWLLLSRKSDVVVAATENGDVSGVTIGDGTHLWQRSMDTQVREPAMSPNGARIYVPTGSPQVTAVVLDVRDGTETGRISLGAPARALQVAPQGWLLVTQRDQVDVLDPSDGAQVDAIRYGQGLRSSVQATFIFTGVGAHGRMIFASDDGTIGAFALPPTHRIRQLAGHEGTPPMLNPDEPCPISVIDQRVYGEVLVGSRVEIWNVATHPARAGSPFIFDVPGATLPDQVTLKGVRLDASGSIMLRDSTHEEWSDQVELHADERRLSPNYPPHWAIQENIPQPGCWAYAFEGPGPGPTEMIVFEVTPQDLASSAE